jgi:hypothetical protein
MYRVGSSSAPPVTGWRGRKTTNSGHESGRSARRFRANNSLTHRSKFEGKNSIVCAGKRRLVWFQVDLLLDDHGQCE